MVIRNLRENRCGRSFDPRFLSVAFLILLASCASSFAHNSTQWSIYSRVDGGSPSLAVSDRSVVYVELHKLDDIDAAVEGIDQGSPAGDCSDNTYKCFNFGGLDLIVPRFGSEKSWFYRNTACERSTDDHDWWVITCRRGRRAVTFDYKPDYGVFRVSFDLAGSAFVHFSGHPLMAP